jgi:Putative zinc-finger
MSTHPSVEQLSAFLDEELEDAVRRTLEEHLRTCDACSAHLADLAAVDEAARALPVEAPAGYFDDFAARVRARVETRAPRRRTLPVWTFAAAAALLLAVVTPLALRERAAHEPTAAVEAPRSAPVLPPAVPQQQEPAGAADTRVTESDRALVETRGRRAEAPPQDDRLLSRDQTAPSAPKPQFQGSQDKQDKQELAVVQPEPAPTNAPLARREARTSEEPGASGNVAPAPATSQRQHGPRSQQFAPPPPAAGGAPADEAGAPSALEERVDALSDAGLAKEKDADGERAKRAAAPERSAGAGFTERKLGATAMKAAPPAARTGAEARERREAFRAMALDHENDTASDEARVRTIEEGVRAYRLEGRAEDRATAERDGRAYLARPDALQAPRVRALLKTLGEPRS